MNIVLQIISMVLCAMGLFLIIIGSRMLRRSLPFYIAFYALLFVYVSMILTIVLLEGVEGKWVHDTIKLLVYGNIQLAFTVSYIFICWMIHRIDPHKEMHRPRIAATSIMICQTVFLIAAYLTDIGFYIDEANRLHRIPGYIAFLLMWMLSLIFASYLMIRYHKRLRFRASLPVFISISVVAIIGGVMQFFFSDMYFMSLSVAVSAIIYDIYFIRYLIVRIHKAEQEAEKLRVEMMLSQIQPHFLYNSLTTIKNLCRTNPEVAGDAVAMFAVYLRGNMSSLSASAPIPFVEELKHTRAYLSLERLRFGDELKLVEELECVSFRLPALTLQPIVENAVRHGIRESESGAGTVVIATREYPDRFEITVTDDGTGFDVNSLEQLDPHHVGVRNVRWRLENMCGGTLTMQSTIGKGTKATITLPKEMQIIKDQGVEDVSVYDR